MMKRRIMILVLLIVAMVASVFGVAACDSDGITLSATEVSVEVGGTVTVTATVSSGDSVTWTSGDTGIATVSQLANAAIVKGVAEGTTTLTATAGEYTATCTVNVTAAVTYTISLNGTAVESADVVRTQSITLTAAASDDSEISYWYSEDSSIATVEDGVVTGVSYGTTTIYAGKDSSHCGSITLNVVAAEGTVGYTIEFATETEALASTSDTWYYWTEYSEITQNLYEDGAIILTFSNNAGNWYNLQIFYKNTTLTEGCNYKLTLKVNTTAAGSITVNGMVVALVEGDNNVTITYTESTGSSASIQFGVNGSGAPDIVDATVTLSDFVWTEIQAETLVAPSFSVSDSGVITITDTNDADKVGSYKLYLYDSEGNLAGAVDVEDGMNVSELDTSAISIGTYKAYLKAIGASTAYTDSANSTEYITIEVTEEPTYSLSYALQSEAVANPGMWYYWNSSWAPVESTYADNTVTITFSNNAGFWYDVQLFYKNPSLSGGNTYTLTFSLNSSSAGTITVNGTVITIVEGDNNIEVSYTESSSSASVSIQFGYSDDTDAGATDIKAATMILSGFAWELTATGTETGDDSGETYDAADFTVLVDTLDTESTYDITHNDETTAKTNTDTLYV